MSLSPKWKEKAAVSAFYLALAAASLLAANGLVPSSAPQDGGKAPPAPTAADRADPAPR